MIPGRIQSNLIRLILVVAASVTSFSEAYAIYIDGDGHYALRGETRTVPVMSGRNRTYQAIDESFRLNEELRFNDQSSFFIEFKLFDQGRRSYLGDQSQPEQCAPRRGAEDGSCSGRHQDVAHPGYKPYDPKVTKAYARYAFESCILEAGRRGRDWGLGIFLDSGNKPFDKSMSVFDGVTCDLNIQKSQEIGFFVGYDKLSESGAYPYNPFDNPIPPQGTEAKCNEDASLPECEGKYSDYNTRVRQSGLGPAYRQDDQDQFFFGITYDDHHKDSSARLTKQIGIYAASISSAADGAGSGTDLKLFDLYLAFFMRSFTSKIEIFGRQGRSGDPNFSLLGGAQMDSELVRNNVQTFAMAGNFEWTLASKGTTTGPEDFKQGDASRHLLFMDYAIAPGSGQGYYGQTDTAGNYLGETEISMARRTSHETQAVAFHRNYKPALIFFNECEQYSYLRVDGAFDPCAVMNATVLAFGYRYEDLTYGNFEAKVVTGQLSESIPTAVKEYYQAADRLAYRRPIGFYGKDLGYELDLKYTREVNRQVDLGLAAGYALPGSMWQTLEGESPKNNLLVQSSIALKF